MKARTLALFFVSLLGLSVAAAPLLPADGKVEFRAVGRPSAIKISGKAGGPKGDITITNVGAESVINGSAEIGLNDFETGIPMRDRHLKEKYFETEKYPTAVLNLKDFKLPVEILEKGGKVSGTAELSLHGETRPIELSLQLTPASGKVKAAGEFKIKISDYKIDVPRFSGITVADEVTVYTETAIAR